MTNLSLGQSSSLLGGDDAKLEEVYKQTHALSEFLDPANYKSYNELKARLNEVLGDAEVERDYENDDVPMDYAPAPKSAPDPMENAPAASSSGDKDDETLSYFAKLAQS